MKRLALLLVCYIALSSLSFSQERPKIGLALAGGGAKGIAHIPILKELDDLDIPIDCIAGTSAGGIVGGLYAAGYSAAEIEKLVLAMDWDNLFSDSPPRSLEPYDEKKFDGRYQLELPVLRGMPAAPRGLIQGQKFYQLFSWLLFPYSGDIDFDALPIPFRSVTVDIVTGRQVVLERGSLAKALRATMAIPSVLAPVEWDDYLLVDGGLLNNLPADVTKEMGADIVIAIDLTSPLEPRSKLARADKVLGQAIRAIGMAQNKDKLAPTDILIVPNMRGLSATDYFFPAKLEKIREQGEIAARLARPTLQALKQKYGLSRSASFRQAVRSALAGRLEKRTISRIVVSGNESIPTPLVLESFGLKSGDRVDGLRIMRGVDELYSLGTFEVVHYDIFCRGGPHVDLHLTLREKPRARLNLGARYDDYHKLVGIAGLRVSQLHFPGLRLEAELEAGGLTRLGARIYYLKETGSRAAYPLIYAGYKDVPSRFYEGNGELLTSYKDRSFRIGAGLGLNLRKSVNVEASYEQEAMSVRPRTPSARPEIFTDLDATLRKIRLVAGLDTRDDAILPREGLLLRALYEGSLELLDTDVSFRRLEVSLDAYKSFSKASTARFCGYWGSATSETPFYKYLNRGRPQDFIGLQYDQLQGHSMKSVRAEYRHQYMKFLYLKFIGNAAFDFAQRGPGLTYSPGLLWGVGAGIMIPTPAGPIELIGSVGSRSLLEPETPQGRAYLAIGARF